MVLDLYGYWRSSAAYRVRIALNLKGLGARQYFVHLRRGEQRDSSYLELNPLGRVPILVADGRPITQSLAILEYLEERFPDPPLLPADSFARAQVRALAQVIACDIHPLNNISVLNYLESELHVSSAEKQVWYRHWVALGFAALERLLTAAPTSGRYCHGNSPGLADLCLVPQVYNARRYGCDLDPYPRIRQIDAACAELDDFRRAAPEVQADAEL